MKVDNEVAGDGNSYTTFFRELDTRLGRWWAVDPKVASQPYQSSYCSMDNNPIRYNDVLGDEIKNKYEEHKNNDEKISGLKEKLKTLDDKNIRSQLKDEIKQLKADLNNYKKTEAIIGQFKNKVGEEEYNKLNTLSLNGKEMDIVVELGYKSYDENGILQPVQSAETGIPYVGHYESSGTFIITDINNTSQFVITLYDKDIGSLANEFGDCIFSVEQTKKSVEEANKYGNSTKGYQGRASTKFSFDYAGWVKGEIKEKPLTNDY
jgi:hypothetical protein